MRVTCVLVMRFTIGNYENYQKTKQANSKVVLTYIKHMRVLLEIWFMTIMQRILMVLEWNAAFVCMELYKAHFCNIR